jgi:DNA-binding NarL/FixJ family response regulator
MGLVITVVRTALILSAPGSTLAAALVASLALHGWVCTSITGPLDSELERLKPIIVILEDEQGRLRQLAADAWARGNVFIGSRRTLDTMIRACERGALALDQDMPFLRLVSAVAEALADHGEPGRARSVAALAALRARRLDLVRLGSLTPRERDVLFDLADGRLVADIATDRFRSISTVRSQVQSLLTKLHATSQIVAVAVANRAGHRTWPEGKLLVGFINFDDDAPVRRSEE